MVNRYYCPCCNAYSKQSTLGPEWEPTHLIVVLLKGACSFLCLSLYALCSPVCCFVLPRRWQTLMTPAICPPLATSSQHTMLGDRRRLTPMRALHHRRLAASGRAMGCSFLRLEDVALSDRFCVFESFEIKPVTMFSNEDRDACGDGNSSDDRPCASGQLYVADKVPGEQAPERTSRDKVLASRCFRCARDRQLSLSKERPVTLNGNAVCGIEIEGPCAGFIMRSHILVDEVRLHPARSTSKFTKKIWSVWFGWYKLPLRTGKPQDDKQLFAPSSRCVLLLREYRCLPVHP